MKTCYLHIGTHKTASTFIQRMIAANEGELADEGVVVPLPESRLTRHKDLAWELRRLRGDDPPTEQWSALSDVLAGVDRDVLISHEGFSQRFIQPGALDFVKGFFAGRGFRLELICFVRDQPAYINSRYAQEVKRFYHALDFPDYVEQILAGEMPHYDYATAFESILADDEVRAHFVPFKGRATDPWGEFTARLPVSADRRWNPINDDTANPNPGIKAIFTARLLNRTLTGLGYSRPELFELRRPLKRQLRRRNWSAQGYMGLDDEMTDRLVDHFRDSNERFAKEVWGSSWTDVFTPGSYERREFDFERAGRKDRDEVLTVYNQLLRLATLGEEPPAPKRRRPAEASGPTGIADPRIEPPLPLGRRVARKAKVTARRLRNR